MAQDDIQWGADHTVEVPWPYQCQIPEVHTGPACAAGLSQDVAGAVRARGHSVGQHLQGNLKSATRIDSTRTHMFAASIRSAGPPEGGAEHYVLEAIQWGVDNL